MTPSKGTASTLVLTMVSLACFWTFLIDTVAARERYALVIGNGAYKTTSPLRNPPNDARLMEATLTEVGFRVTTLVNASRQEMQRAMLDFGRALRSGNVEAGLFYYAGHGVQVKGQNYLIPVNAQIQAEDEVDLEGINVNNFLQVMETSQSNINIVILDACRNNPFAGSFRSVTRGLATVNAPKGTLIAYSTAPGKVALDGKGSNSPYTTALVRSISEFGNQPVESVFKETRRRVLKRTGDQQLPWETSSVIGDFILNSAPGVQDSTGIVLPDQAAFDTEKMESIVDAFERALLDGTATGWEDFLDRYGSEQSSFYVQSARQQLAAITPTAIAPATIERTPSPISSHWKCTGRNAFILYGRLCVSSVLSPQYGNRYGGNNLLDNDNATAWVEGVRGDGVDEAVAIEFSEPTTVSRIELKNGYNKRKDLYIKNGRVSDLSIETSNGFKSTVSLADQGGWQSIDIPDASPVSWIKISIRSVYRGTRYRDTAITELRVR